MVKLATLLPLITQGGGFSIDGLQWFIPDELIPMWIRRLIVVSFALTPMVGPWISLLTLAPFKREFKRRFRSAFRSTYSISLESNRDVGVAPAR